jgi:hypothetical protein
MRLVLAAALLLLIAAGTGAPQAAAPALGPARAGQTVGHYAIAAHVFLLGNVGNAGSLTIESSLREAEGRLTKTLRMAGGTTPEQAKKNRDFRGEFNLLETSPVPPADPSDGHTAEEGGAVERSSAAFIKLNKKSQTEKMTFFPDHALVYLDDKPEKRVDGSYGCLLTPLAYLMEHEIKVGDVIDTPFLLKGVPRVFRMEVEGSTTLSPYKARAYEISLYAVETTTGADKPAVDVWRKKGNLKIWFCKEGPYRNQMLRLKVKFRWYLWLYFDLRKVQTS